MLPILFQNHDLILYSYPLLMGLGWGVAYQVFFSRVQISPIYGQLLFWGIFLSSWIGSKLFFYFTTTPNYKNDLLLEPSFWTGGGFVFYGGLLFALVFLGLYKLLKFPLTVQNLWAMLPALTLGHAIGRIGCFLAGCCYGSETSAWWGIHLHGANRYPTQLIESLGLFIISFYLFKSRASQKSFSVYFIGYGILRFGIELLRGDEIRGFWGSLTPSQWISLFLISLGFILLLSKQFGRLQFLQPK
jgi:phosphatidylglycerol:prolipoprotein diacylglycerol transferase